VPQDRAGRFSTELFQRYQRSEKALVGTLAEMYVQGVSTRKVKAVTETLCGHSFSASAISSINKSLDEALRAFAERRLSEPFPYLIRDARYEKVREAGVIVSQAVLIAVAVEARIIAAAIGQPRFGALAFLGPDRFAHLRFQRDLQQRLQRRLQKILVTLQQLFHVNQFGLTFAFGHGVLPCSGWVMPTSPAYHDHSRLTRFYEFALNRICRTFRTLVHLGDLGIRERQQGDPDDFSTAYHS
jgi:mutator family transposase